MLLSCDSDCNYNLLYIFLLNENVLNVFIKYLIIFNVFIKLSGNRFDAWKIAEMHYTSNEVELRRI